MQVGDKVKIQDTNTFWDNKTGVVESINDDVATIMVDFIPEEGKKVRQDFSLNNIASLNNECYNIKESLREDMDNIIKEVDWNGHHYTFTNTFKNTGTKSHDILTMSDENGNSWTGETTWVNRPWHRFDLEEAFTTIVSKAFGPKALELIRKINSEAYSVSDAIDKFFARFKLEDISSNEIDTNNYDDDIRRQALANYLQINEDEIELIDDNHEFQLEDGSTYLVLTDDEANEVLEENVRNLWNDLGLSGVGGWMHDWILENALDEDELEGLVEDEIRDDIFDYMSDEEVVEDCIDHELISREDAYDEEDNLRDDLDLDDLRETLVGARMADVDNYGEYLKDMGYDDEWLSSYIDEEKVIDALIDDIDVNGSGRGQEIAWYDGDEIELENGLYAYRTN